MPSKLTLRIALGLLAAVLVVLFLTMGPQACTSLFTAKKEARVAKGQAGAAIKAGETAVKTAGANSEASDVIDETVKDGNNEIDKAPVGKRNDASLRATCRMRSYRDSERCAAMRKADSARVE